MGQYDDAVSITVALTIVVSVGFIQGRILVDAIIKDAIIIHEGL